MGVINVLVEILIGVASQFTRPLNETMNVIHSITGITFIQLINMGLLLIFVSISFHFNILGFTNPPGILEGSFLDFTSPWYTKYGTQIVFTFVVEIAIPHGVPLLLIIVFSIWRCSDRSCTRDRRKTKQLLQNSYEQLYTGPEFMLENRLAQIIALTWCAFMFSTCMPVIILVTFFNFLAMYWIDKFLVLRFYRTPKNWDEETITYSLSMLKWTFLFHLLMGEIMLSY